MGECYLGGTGKKEWRYGWSKAPYSLSTSGNTSVSVRAGEILYYSDAITFNEQTKTVTLINPVSIIASNNVGLNLTGKYVGTNQSIVLSESAGTEGFGKAKKAVEMWEFNGAWYGMTGVENLLIIVGAISGCVVADTEDAYPNNGLKSGYKHINLIT